MNEAARVARTPGNLRGGRFAEVATIFGAIATFVVLAATSVRHVNTQFDEAFDLRAAEGILEHPLLGNGVDPLNARLPHYVVALTLALTRPGGYHATLVGARATSIAANALTLWLVWRIGRRWQGPTTGLMAAWLLAIAPLFLHCGALALTQADAFCATTVALAVWTCQAYLDCPDGRRALVLGVALGAAIGAKFTLILLPGVLAASLVGPVVWRSRGGAAAPAPMPRALSRGAFSGVGLAVGCALAALCVVQIATPRGGLAPPPGVQSLVTLLWAGGVASLLAGAAALVWSSADTTADRAPLLAWARHAFFIGLVAMASVLLLMPEHIFGPTIARAFVEEVTTWEHGGGYWLPRSASVYSGALLFKLGWPLGLCTLAAMAWCLARLGRDLIATAALLLVLGYNASLLFKPTVMIYYEMTAYPLLALVLAGWLTRLIGSSHRGVSRAGLLIAVGGLSYLAWGTARVYPAFGFYSLETIGEDWLGQKTRQPNGLVATNWDGAEDALAWCRTHVAAEQRVGLWLYSNYPVQRLLDETPPPFSVDLRKAALGIAPPDDLLADSDYVILDYDAVKPPGFDEQFELAHAIWRGRGVYRTCVARVFSRRGRTPEARPASARGVTHASRNGGHA